MVVHEVVSIGGHFRRRDMSDVSDGINSNSTRGTYGNPCQATVMKTESKPSFGRKLEGSADEVSNNVRMTH